MTRTVNPGSAGHFELIWIALQASRRERPSHRRLSDDFRHRLPSGIGIGSPEGCDRAVASPEAHATRRRSTAIVEKRAVA